MALPRVVVDALVPDLRRLPGGLVLHPLSIARMLLLEKIESPFLAVDGERSAAAKGSRKARGGAAKGSLAGLDGLAVVYLLTRSEGEIDQLFFGFDRAAFDAAVWKFAKEQKPALLVGLQEKLTAIFEQATSTLIGGGADDTPEDQKKTT